MSVVWAWPELQASYSSSVDQLRVNDGSRTCASNPRKEDVPAARHRIEDSLLPFPEFHVLALALRQLAHRLTGMMWP